MLPSYSQQAFADAVRYNISRYLQLMQTTTEQLADALGLSIEELQDRLFDREPLSVWELDRCACFFRCSPTMLYPDTQVLQTDALWDLTRKLPEAKLKELSKHAKQLAQESGIDCR